MELIRNTPGVVRTVSFGGKPQSISNEEIESLQRIIGTDRDISSFPYFTAGQKVRIIAGPLAGISGVILEFRQRHRLVISVDIIMQSVSVEIDQSEVILAQHSGDNLPR